MSASAQKDGTYLDGPLGSLSSQIEENDDRSIQLIRPERTRTSSAGRSELVEWDVDAVIVSASQIKTISVNYLPKGSLVGGDAQHRSGIDGEHDG